MTNNEGYQDNTYFILLHDKDGVVLPQSTTKSVLNVGAMVVNNVVNTIRGRSNSTFRALKGSLYKLIPGDDMVDIHNVSCGAEEKYIVDLVAVNNTHHFIQRCNLNDLRKLSSEEYAILIAVPTDLQRIDVIRQYADGKSQLTDACNAKTGDFLKVNLGKGGEWKTGTLTFKGKLEYEKSKKGVYFGVKFAESVSGLSDHTNETFFSVHQLEFSLEDKYLLRSSMSSKKDTNNSNQQKRRSNEHLDVNDLEKQDKGYSKFVMKQVGRQHSKKGIKDKTKWKSNNEINLPLGTRVICFLGSKSKPFPGTVRFYDHVGNEGIMAGVELDEKNPQANSMIGHCHNKRKIFECNYGKGIILKPDQLIKEEEYIDKSPGKQTYVTVNDDNHSFRTHELEKKEVKSPEYKSIDPIEEQKELFRKLEEKKHASLSTVYTQNSVHIENDESREQHIECQIQSHDRSIQGLKDDLGRKLSSNEYVTDQDTPSYEVYESQANTTVPSTHYAAMDKEKQNIPKGDLHLSHVPVDERTVQSKLTNEQLLLQAGSMVEIIVNSKKYYGVLKWKGVSEKFPSIMFAGIELESNELTGCTNGIFLGRKYFESPLNRAFFMKLHLCQPDSRFSMQDTMEVSQEISFTVNPIQNLSIKGSFLPISKLEVGYLGRNKGIQGHFNSCYMDSCLFAMFGYSHVFDVMLNRKKRHNDIDDYETVQTILREQIVNPLRKEGFVGHPSVFELRKYLNKLGDIGGFMTEEKDPEEFIVLLFEKVLNVDPFIRLHVNGREEVSHLYQIFFPKEENNPLPSIQYLLEYSFLSSNLKLAEIPSIMVLQMPRFGQEKLYKRVQIKSTLDITSLLADEIQSCIVCGQFASSHCPACACLFGWDIVHTYLCDNCWYSVHKHPKRHYHQQPAKSQNSRKTCTPYPVLLDLFAVVCIEKSHYVSFVKCGSGENEEWLFFDSMADRIGGENGHNIPEVTLLDNLRYFLSGTPLEISELDKKANELILRVFDDASLCFYHNKNLTMYR